MSGGRCPLRRAVPSGANSVKCGICPQPTKLPPSASSRKLPCVGADSLSGCTNSLTNVAVLAGSSSLSTSPREYGRSLVTPAPLSKNEYDPSRRRRKSCCQEKPAFAPIVKSDFFPPRRHITSPVLLLIL